MERADNGLAFMLQFENVAWYEDGIVRILDRRIYPIKTEYVICRKHQEVAKAIADMVTQSAGPYTAAAMGMALAAYEARDKKEEELFDYMEKAAYTLSHARPTTMMKMSRIVNGGLDVVKAQIEKGEVGQALVDALFQYAVNYINNNYLRFDTIAENFNRVIPDNATIMTQCFAETIIGTLIRCCHQHGKDIKMICAETRPYFQGSRLTASVAKDMGVDVTVICDNMPGYTMRSKKVDLFTSAADVICQDGYIVNKVGTFQIALMANYFGIPYYVTGAPNPSHKTIDSVKIEERDENLVMESMGTRLCMEGVKGYYPVFDITPPNLCSGVVTNKGIYSPRDLASYFEK